MGYCTGWWMTPADKVYHNTEWGMPLHDDANSLSF